MSRDKMRQQIAEYLSKEPNMFRNDRQAYLERMVDDMFFQREKAHAINRFDLLQIISNGGHFIAKKALPLTVTNKEMDQSEVRSIAMIEAVIGYLNSKGLLNREVAMDYTSSEYKFESLED